MNNTTKSKYIDEDTDIIFNNTSKVLDFSVKTRKLNNFIVHINTDIKEPEHYSKVFDMLIDCNEEDMVSFFIASPGGRIDGLNVLLEGIRITDAHTVAILIGEAHSAASILALSCDEVVVTPSAEALIHSCRFGSYGKAADLAAHTKHTLKTTEKLARTVYEGFLNPDEMQQMLDGKEFYFDSEELQERLEKRNDYFDKKDQKDQAEQKASEVVQTQPKRKPKIKV